MANIDTAEYTAQQNRVKTLTAAPSLRKLQRPVCYATYDTITLTSASANDDIRLGKLGVDGVLIPELCRLVGLTGSVQGVFTLEKVNSAGTVTAISGGATLATDGTSVAFARVAAGSPVAFTADDEIQLTITTATATAIGDTLKIELCYAQDKSA